jgi:hypothetical protein
MPLNDSQGAPVWQAHLCSRIREASDEVRRQLDAAELAIDREDAEALSVALSLGMSHYVKAVNAAFDMLIAPSLEATDAND